MFYIFDFFESAYRNGFCDGVSFCAIFVVFKYAWKFFVRWRNRKFLNSLEANKFSKVLIGEKDGSRIVQAFCPHCAKQSIKSELVLVAGRWTCPTCPFSSHDTFAPFVKRKH